MGGAPGSPAHAPAAKPVAVDGDEFIFEGLSISKGPSKLVADGQNFVAKLEDFSKVRLLGKGTHGQVWLVNSRSLGIPMAMKVMELGVIDRKAAKRIVRELSVLKKATGFEYITALHGAFYKSCNVYILMEYMDAGSLDTLLAQHAKAIGGGIPEPVIAAVGHSALHGLRFLREQLKVMHRDIKPANILVNMSGQFKVCDFSICAELQSHTFADTYIGTIYYMAPERINPAKDKRYKITADIWSIGVTLVELATGEYPYPRETDDVFAMLKHIVDGPTPVESAKFADAGLTADCTDFCQSCMHKTPEDRADHHVLLKHKFLESATSDDTAEHVIRWLRAVTDSSEGERGDEDANSDADTKATNT
mmetsp:Transcript_17382/g.51420  ORF Transcript_17382/g.51420 Transcript_17382/m.51420 type:complete len:364 (+) Transcript_17382:1-1092(+)